VTIVRVKGFKIYRDCRQKMRCYHRKTDEPVDLKKNPIGSAGFFAECARISALAEAKVAEREKSGTLGALICNYRKSSAFRDGLAPRTQADYQKVFDYLRPIADTPLVRFNRPLVVRIRDKAAETKGKRFGNYVKAGLSIIFTWGCERGFLENNPASRIKDLRRKKGAPEANRPWADQERYAVLEEAPAHFRPVIALMMFTGLGPKEAVTLPRNFAKAGEIATRRSKTGEPVFWPMPDELTTILDKAPAHNAVTLCANSRGRPWSLSGLSSAWRTLRVRLEKEGLIGQDLTPYGLRHTVAVILRECDCDERTIADALGQKTIEMARHYAKGADLTRKMRGVVKNFDAELARRRGDK
jgi:integrase